MNETTSNQVMDTRSDTQFKKMRGFAMVVAAIVYIGVVIAATTMFISFITTAFPENDFFSRAVMGISGFLVGCSMVAFPIALHYWAVSGTHRAVAIGFYLGEIGIVAVNTITSFAALRYQNAGVALPPWIQWYEPLSIVSIVYTLLAWGVIFLMDPAIQRLAKDRASKEKFLDRVQERATEFLETVEGEEAIERVAMQVIQDKFRPNLDKKKHWGNGHLEENSILARLPHEPSRSLPAPTPMTNAKPEPSGSTRPLYNEASYTRKPQEPDRPAVPPEHYRDCPACENRNVGNAQFCSACGWNLNEPVVGYYRGDPMTKAMAEKYGLKRENGANP